MVRQRTAMVERMRRAEPAPDVEEAAAAVALAREALRQWRINVSFLLMGFAVAVRMVFEEPMLLRILGVTFLVASVPMAVWAFLNRQAALRAVDANQRRWGDL